MRLIARPALTLALILALSAPAGAVVVLDSTWKENGGRKGAESEGFDAHEALAAQPQFAASFGLWGGEEYGGSGTWIGNDEQGHGYILTAGHNFDGDADPSAWLYYATDGSEYQGVELYINPDYDPYSDETGGFDIAIVKLDGPVKGVGKPAAIYGGSDELGKVLTIVGYGSRGIGSKGEAEKYYDYENPVAAAARNVIDEVDGPNGENCLIFDMDSEDGDSNALDGDAEPVDEYEGILGSGDSGGAGWIKTGKGWAIAGVNSWGDSDRYAGISALARVSKLKSFIRAVYPEARFIQ